MTERQTLEAYLGTLESAPDLQAAGEAVGATVLAIAGAGREIAKILARGLLAGNLSAIVGESLDGDGQKELDVTTHNILRDALVQAPVAVFASEEANEPEILNCDAALAVAVDPLDGSSNIDTLAPIGTIFSILPAARGTAQAPESPFLQPGRNQLAAGFIIYGPQTALVLSAGAGTHMFTLDPTTEIFMMTKTAVKIPPTTREYAINSSNFYHWDREVSSYVVELMLGKNGPRGENFNTRWVASMVADAYRILQRGGIYLYPADQRPGYRNGRLRLVYEANPIAMLIEQAGGAATDGRSSILDLTPTDLHQRCPLMFGSAREIARFTSAYAMERMREAPLFNERTLFRQSSATFDSRI